MIKHSTKKIGDMGENYAADYLKRQKYKIIERNYRKRCGEIDIIAEKNGVIAFVEVKTRHSNTLAQPFEAVDRRKQEKIIKTAVNYISENKIDCDCRFDVCEVFVDKDCLKLRKINYYENAFMMESDYGYY